MTRAVRAAIDAEDPGLDDSAVTVTTEFVAAGTVYAILRWLEQEDRDRQAIVDHLVHMMPAVLADPSVSGTYR